MHFCIKKSKALIVKLATAMQRPKAVLRFESKLFYLRQGRNNSVGKHVLECRLLCACLCNNISKSGGVTR